MCHCLPTGGFANHGSICQPVRAGKLILDVILVANSEGAWGDIGQLNVSPGIWKRKDKFLVRKQPTRSTKSRNQIGVSSDEYNAVTKILAEQI